MVWGRKEELYRGEQKLTQGIDDQEGQDGCFHGTL